MDDSAEGTFDQVFVVEAEYGVVRDARTESGRDRFLLLSVPVAYRGVWKEVECRRSVPAGVFGGRKTFEWRPGLTSVLGAYNGPKEGDRESREGERAEAAISCCVRGVVYRQR
jgi:hypothetical protein